MGAICLEMVWLTTLISGGTHSFAGVSPTFSWYLCDKRSIIILNNLEIFLNKISLLLSLHSFWNDVQHPPHCSRAAESNNLTQLKDALDAWSTQEILELPKALGQPMYSFQPALEIALKLRHVDVADELLHRGCWISPGTVLPSYPP